jgi:hypothetical protein
LHQFTAGYLKNISNRYLKYSSGKISKHCKSLQTFKTNYIEVFVKKKLIKLLNGRWGAGTLLFITSIFLPLGTRLILCLPELAFTKFTDSVFYLSYSQSFQELFLHHGFIYYASRFGAIFPDAVAFNLFGPTDGPVFLRLFLACLVSGSLFLVGRLYFSPLIGILASLLWSFQPVAARLWCTTYLDSSAVPFLILGVCMLVLFRASCAAAFFTGILLAFSVTSHLYLVILAACLVPLVVGARWGDRRVLFCNQLPWLLGGFLLTLAAAFYWYAVNCGIGAFWQPTLELMRKMSDGQTELWKKPLVAAIVETPLWFAPFPLLVWAAVYWKRLDAFGSGAFCALILSTVFFWAGDLIGGAYALSMPFYFSFLLPVLLFSLIAFAGNAARHSKSSLEYSTFVLCAAAAVAGPMILKAQSKWPWPITFSLCAVAVLGCSLYFFRRAFQQTAFIFCLLFLSYLTLATGFFSQFLADVKLSSPFDKKLPAIAEKIRDSLPPASGGEVVRFWYPDGNTNLKMLQSFFLHTFSLLPGQSGFSTYPNATAADAAAIKAAGVQDIVLLDTDAARLNRAMDSLSNAGLSFDTAQANIQRLGKENIFVLRLKVQMPDFSSWVPLDLRTIQVAKNAAVAFGTKSVIVTTSDRRWNFDALLPVLKSESNKSHLLLKLWVIAGRVEVSSVFKDSNGGESVTASVEAWPTPNAVEYVLESYGSRPVENILIRNKMPDTAVSKVEIYEVNQRAK